MSLAPIPSVDVTQIRVSLTKQALLPSPHYARCVPSLFSRELFITFLPRRLASNCAYPRYKALLTLGVSRKQKYICRGLNPCLPPWTCVVHSRLNTTRPGQSTIYVPVRNLAGYIYIIYRLDYKIMFGLGVLIPSIQPTLFFAVSNWSAVYGHSPQHRRNSLPYSLGSCHHRGEVTVSDCAQHTLPFTSEQGGGEIPRSHRNKAHDPHSLWYTL